MITVVFDTNVLLDLFVFNDFRALHLKQALIEKRIDAVASPKTLEEFVDVIARPLFCLDKSNQNLIWAQWHTLSRVLNDSELMRAPWQCQDPDDQVFLDIAFTVKPCVLMSKDNEVLKLANRAAKENIHITSNYNALSI
ncbi:putative toxin-antitoxin system toxin component, PIN family [Polynucleobacter asymbioticus]|uniref:PIN domain-containing protein n=1 Tax=Polynucleobacter asymbioticus TaxID=576611 RepID=A0AAC9NHE0_9BURK|nr:putative toxin-antitoxin system toxin component, PIN family [Polynucleobacter asymbioticus]APB98624.1 PIN domain-containing protein [Polynucleobacter asymbioticus]APC00911.1 PIN domain-containing protein [Polynucleobacter asymbioticus]